MEMLLLIEMKLMPICIFMMFAAVSNVLDVRMLLDDELPVLPMKLTLVRSVGCRFSSWSAAGSVIITSGSMKGSSSSPFILW